MRKSSLTIYKISIYLYLVLAIVCGVLGILYCSVFLINKTGDAIGQSVSTGIQLLIASSITCCESIFAHRAYHGKSTNATALAWGIVGVVGAYSFGALLLIGAIFGLVADNQEKDHPQQIEEPKDKE